MRSTADACLIVVLLCFSTLAQLQAEDSGGPGNAEGLDLRLPTKWKTDSGGMQMIVPIGFKDNPDRNGQVYLPAGHNSGDTLKVMIVLHGAGMYGGQMIGIFRELADKHKIMLVAPDSHKSLQWFSPDAGQDFTVDWWHVLGVYKWAKGHCDCKINDKKVAYVGYSRGGYSAAAMASRMESATHAMVLHSSIDPNQFGANHIPIWVSTGWTDPMFTQRRMSRDLGNFRTQKSGWSITFQTFDGGHSLADSQELNSAVEWFEKSPGSRG